ncbi:Uncharacterized protein PCOAH_00028950 [Plasmodium coatneyi]|uniref:Uncharacterized protein n=1 Tax=Plasmodium coatneyi TaxID=208452 RepID=A0A1B1E0Q7_9APIC|nr:Uncharacterized protein PCOAH_00028950 [Plasmodium coatneyi]ANQ08613.1 Uncharacterized protein PCOAH_00028950 [Plasmodium coatneyi]
MDYTLNDDWIMRRNKIFCDVINNLVTTFYEIQYKFFFVKSELLHINENISHVDILQNIENNLFHVIITFVIDCKALYNLKNAINKTFQVSDKSRVSYYYYLFEHEKFMELFKKLEACMMGCQKLNTYLSRQIDRLKNNRTVAECRHT